MIYCTLMKECWIIKAREYKAEGPASSSEEVS